MSEKRVLIDEAGKTHNRWYVISRAPNRSSLAYWNCRCQCGVERIVSGVQLRSGRSKSCGCFRAEVSKNRFTTHGDTQSKEWMIWQSMKQRCVNPASQQYRDYGGRGISVCERWGNSYELFLADMGRKPSAGHSLDRIDNDGNYEPGNVRWATRAEQLRNRRDNRWVTFEGKTMVLADAMALSVVNPRCVQGRILRGWDSERALTEPSTHPHNERHSIALCHPDRKHYCLGMCEPCYDKLKREKYKTRPTSHCCRCRVSLPEKPGLQRCVACVRFYSARKQETRCRQREAIISNGVPR